MLSLLLMFAGTARPALSAAAPLWFHGGRPTAAAVQAVEILASAAGQGLDPRDYDAGAIARDLTQALQGPAPAQAAQTLLDTTLTAALERYLSDLSNGRVDPRRVHAAFDLQARPPMDLAALLREAAATGRLAEAVAQAEPPLPMYGALRAALARYRALLDHPAWQAPLPRLPGRKLVAGQAWAGLPLLAERLQALGDLPAASVTSAGFDSALALGLQAFQERHGLAADGVLGPATLQQLDVTPASRARQIELSLERLRWTPLLQAPRMIVVNVPEFVLRAYEVHNGRVDVQLTMKVIVGKALDTRTPLFDEDMRYIEFSPYWNVPPSIARAEIVPRLRSDPAHFHQQGFEFVTRTGQVVGTLAPDHLEAVLRRAWRIRQRPGPKNALGGIKFVFPNNANIYLHHTASPKLFARQRRDLSHGCIRVEDPVALARFVLRDEPGWTEGRIREAMARGTSSMLALKQPLPVLVAYSTAIVKGTRAFFYPDLYGHDRLLDSALRRRSAELGPLAQPASGSK